MEAKSFYPQAAEFELSEAILACSNLEEKERGLGEREREMQAAKKLKAHQRLQNRTRMRVNAERSRRAQERCVREREREEGRRGKEGEERGKKRVREGGIYMYTLSPFLSLSLFLFSLSLSLSLSLFQTT